MKPGTNIKELLTHVRKLESLLANPRLDKVYWWQAYHKHMGYIATFYSKGQRRDVVPMIKPSGKDTVPLMFCELF
jgi:hypothetical protein